MPAADACAPCSTRTSKRGERAGEDDRDDRGVDLGCGVYFARMTMALSERGEAGSPLAVMPPTRVKGRDATVSALSESDQPRAWAIHSDSLGNACYLEDVARSPCFTSLSPSCSWPEPSPGLASPS